MNTDKISLYMQDASGGIRVWSIWVEDYELQIEHGTLGGELQFNSEHIPEGLAARSREEQVLSRVNSKINKKKDKGYTTSLEYARAHKPKNRLGHHKPMKAKRYDGSTYINFSKVYVQYKYDGHRCLITNSGGEKIAYSSNGKLIPAVGHILCDMDIPEDVTLDGELYIHGVRLQRISSLVKKQQDGTERVKFYCYDIVEDAPYPERLNLLASLKLGANAVVAPTWHAEEYGVNSATIGNHLCEAKEQGYEGLMLRLDGPGYEAGRRTSQLLKVKSCIDDEFTVVGIGPSKDGWAILTCVMKSGKTFTVSAPGTVGEKTQVLANAAEYIGKSVRVEFAAYTEDGKPFHGVALSWRDKTEE